MKQNVGVVSFPNAVTGGPDLAHAAKLCRRKELSMKPATKNWVTERFGRFTTFSRRNTGYQRKVFVYDNQKYVIEGLAPPGDHIMTISPLPALNGSRTDYWPREPMNPGPGTEPDLVARVSDCRAHAEFKILTEFYGKFCGIVVPEQFQRQGVARRMVLALFSQYPNVLFHNTSLNTKSGPFFKALQADFPENLAPVHY